MDFERFRTLNGWSLDDAAEKLKETGAPELQSVNGSLVGKHERGIYFPSPPVVAAYAQITDGATAWSDWNRLREGLLAQGLSGMPPRQRGRKPAPGVLAEKTGT